MILPLGGNPGKLLWLILLRSLTSWVCCCNVIFSCLVCCFNFWKRGANLSPPRDRSQSILPGGAPDPGGPGDCELGGLDSLGRSLDPLCGSSFCWRFASFTYFLLRTSWKPLLSVAKTLWSSSTVTSGWSSTTTTPKWPTNTPCSHTQNIINKSKLN